MHERRIGKTGLESSEKCCIRAPVGSYFHLMVVYIIWGSTFVAMRAAVMEHSGFQPFSVGASRLVVASAILFGWAFIRGMQLRVTRSDLLVCLVSGGLI